MPKNNAADIGGKETWLSLTLDHFRRHGVLESFLADAASDIDNDTCIREMVMLFGKHHYIEAWDIAASVYMSARGGSLVQAESSGMEEFVKLGDAILAELKTSSPGDGLDFADQAELFGDQYTAYARGLGAVVRGEFPSEESRRVYAKSFHIFILDQMEWPHDLDDVLEYIRQCDE
ncbi:MAG: hypothetical protein AABZ39_12185 [Spirochaetota bacterium]